VVGTAMIGAMPLELARVHQSPTSSKSHTGRDCGTMNATHLPTSSAETAADRDDAVMAARAKGSNPCVKICFRWIALHVREDPHLNSCVAEALDETSDQRRLGKPLVGHQQRLGDIQSAASFRQFSDSSSASDNAGWEIPRAGNVANHGLLSVFDAEVEWRQSNSDDFEVTRQLPVGDRSLEFTFLQRRVHCVMIDEDVAKQAARGDDAASLSAASKSVRGKRTFGGWLMS